MKLNVCLRLLLVSVILVGVAGFLPLMISDNVAEAARPTEPHKEYKLRIDDVQWDGNANQFEVYLSCHAGIAQAGAKAFIARVEVIAYREGDPNVVRLSSERAIIKKEGASKDSEGMVQLEPRYLYWGDSWEGQADVTVTVTRMNKTRHIIGNPASARYAIVID